VTLRTIFKKTGTKEESKASSLSYSASDKMQIPAVQSVRWFLVTYLDEESSAREFEALRRKERKKTKKKKKKKCR